MKQVEIERKFLIETPTSWSQIADIFSDLVEVKRISQTYLKKNKDEDNAGRIRQTIQGLVGDKETVYHYNVKKKIKSSNASKHEEYEVEINKKKYDDFLENNKDPSRITLHKSRFVFKFKDQVFELDIFEKELKGLAILEIELKDDDEKVTLPPFLKVIKEVSKEEKYNNFNLSNKENFKNV